MNTTTAVGRRRGLLFALLFLAASVFGIGLTATPAFADATLCSGNNWTTCPNAGYTDHGYGTHSGTMYWRMYAGHNCTNYVAYVESTVNGASTPSYNLGNAMDWAGNASAHGILVDSVPANGAVAQWNADPTRHPAGHVAYVESFTTSGGSVTSITVSEDNWSAGPFRWRTITSGSSDWPSNFIHFQDIVSPPSPPPSDTTMDSAQYKGDFNGDGYDDVAIVHQRQDGGGADVHLLQGGSSPFTNTTTFVRSLPYSDGWRWALMKVTAGDYDHNGATDLAIFHLRQDGGGADVHVLYGASSPSTPFQNTTTFVRSLPYSDGWLWSQMNLTTADFDGNNFDDVAIVHPRQDGGGADVHVLYGASTPFQNTTTFVRSLPYSDGWRWSQMKIAAGRFNNDTPNDLLILHLRQDGGGADVHVLYGASSPTTPFQNTTTFVRSLPYSDGWRWSQMKLATGDFNHDTYTDVAIVHQITSDGMDVHVLYGASTPFQNTTTFARHLYASDGWRWSQAKLVTGVSLSTSAYSNLTLIHLRQDGGGADVHVLYGASTPFQNTTTFVRSLLYSDGWNWSLMKVA